MKKKDDLRISILEVNKITQPEGFSPLQIQSGSTNQQTNIGGRNINLTAQDGDDTGTINLTYGVDKSALFGSSFGGGHQGLFIDGGIVLGDYLDAAAGINLTIENRTANFTPDANETLIDCDATAGKFTIVLPSITSGGVPNATLYHFKKIDASGNAVTIQAASGDTIEGSGFETLASQYQGLTIYNNFSLSTWFKLNSTSVTTGTTTSTSTTTTSTSTTTTSTSTTSTSTSTTTTTTSTSTSTTTTSTSTSSSTSTTTTA